MKRCRVCRQYKPLSEFHHTLKWTRGAQRRYPNSYCKPCASAETQKRRVKHRERFRKMKDGKACELCGWRDDPSLLQYDHLDPSTKKNDVSVLAGQGSPFKAMEEIRKCRLLCPTCHARHTREQREAGVFANAPRSADEFMDKVDVVAENLELFGDASE